MSTKDSIIKERIKKVEEIKKSGVETYYKKKVYITCSISDLLLNSDFRDIKDIQENKSLKNIKTFCIAGRIILFRSMGRLAFGHIQDMSGKIQVCFQKDHFEIEGLNEEFKKPMKFIEKLVDLGDFLSLEGELFKTNHGETTLFVKKCIFLSKSLRPMPEKFHGLKDQETIYRERNLDLMTNKDSMNRFILKSKMVREIRDFFHEKLFIEVETPVLQPQAGGAMSKTFNTYHNALNHEFVLRIALELDHKKIIGGGMERIFEIGKNFRNEGSDPSHLQEFTMLEWYAAYADIEDNKKWTEEFLHRICKNVFKKDIFIVKDIYGGANKIDFSKKFEEKSFPDLLKEHAKLDMFSSSMEDIQNKAKEVGVEKIEGVGRGNLLDDIYKKTSRNQLIQPTFVYNYPEELKPLAAPNGDGTASCFQLVVNGWEIVNSYGELIDPQIQRTLLELQSKAKLDGDEEAMEIDEVFLKAMEHGFPPMTGSGFGIDRLITIFTGQINLRDTVLFPTTKPENKKIDKSHIEIQKLKSLAKKSTKPISRENEEILKNNELEKKFVVVLNGKIEIGRLLNATAHMSFGLAGESSLNMNFLTYEDANNEIHKGISHYNTVILKANNEKEIFKLRELLEENEIKFTDFTRSMTIGSSKEQLKAMSTIFTKDQEYFGICMFGNTEKINKLTSKFSLFK
jgi:lysyl-tRNA synthetase class 2